MTSSYLTRPQIPLTAALSQMLENIETELAHDKLDAIEEERCRWRAELIRRLLTPRTGGGPRLTRRPAIRTPPLWLKQPT